MLTQVILVMRTPFKGQGTIGAQKGTHSSVDALMDLDSDKNTDVFSFEGCFHLPHRNLFQKIDNFDPVPGEERTV